MSLASWLCTLKVLKLDWNISFDLPYCDSAGNKTLHRACVSRKTVGGKSMWILKFSNSNPVACCHIQNSLLQNSQILAFKCPRVSTIQKQIGSGHIRGMHNVLITCAPEIVVALGLVLPDSLLGCPEVVYSKWTEIKGNCNVLLWQAVR